MSKKEQEIYSKQVTSEEVQNYSLTGYSNSRLSVTSMTQNEKISVVFDRITVVGYLIEGRERQLKNGSVAKSEKI